MAARSPRSAASSISVTLSGVVVSVVLLTGSDAIEVIVPEEAFRSRGKKALLHTRIWYCRDEACARSGSSRGSIRRLAGHQRVAAQESTEKRSLTGYGRQVPLATSGTNESSPRGGNSS